MLKFKHLQGALDNWANEVVLLAREKLEYEEAVSTGELLNSISSTGSTIYPNSIEFGITMKDYGAYIDQGVSGTERKYDTDFSYTNKMPPPSAFDGWIVRKGIAPRSSGGQFQSRKSLQFAIAKSIFKKGIYPTHFFSDAVIESQSLLPYEIKESFQLDVDETIAHIFKININNK